MARERLKRRIPIDMEESHRVVFTAAFDPSDFPAFARKYDLVHRLSKPAKERGLMAEAVWTNAEQSVAISLVLDTDTGVHFARVRGYDTHRWAVALKSRYLVHEWDGALAKLAASESIADQKANVLRVALCASSPRAEVFEALARTRDPTRASSCG
jgi:hypothetical protein